MFDRFIDYQVYFRCLYLVISVLPVQQQQQEDRIHYAKQPFPQEDPCLFVNLCTGLEIIFEIVSLLQIYNVVNTHESVRRIYKSTYKMKTSSFIAGR